MSASNFESSLISQKIINYSLDYKHRFSLDHPHLFKTYGFSIPKNLFHNEFVTQPNQIYFENSNISLSKLLDLRKPNKLFTEPDLLAILRGVSSALSYLQINGISHGDIDPSTIFFDMEKGCFKIHDQELLKGKNAGFYFTKKMKKKGFIAPEHIEELRNINKDYILGDFYKADVFALGLTILEAATLTPSSDIYDKFMSVNSDFIDDRLIFIKNFYSPEFTHVVRMMVDIEEDIRPDCIDLYDIITVKKNNVAAEKIYLENIPPVLSINVPNFNRVDVIKNNSNSERKQNQQNFSLSKSQIIVFNNEKQDKIEKIKKNNVDFGSPQIKSKPGNLNKTSEKKRKELLGEMNTILSMISSPQYNEEKKVKLSILENNNKNINILYDSIIEKNLKLEARIDSILQKSQMITKALNI